MHIAECIELYLAGDEIKAGGPGSGRHKEEADRHIKLAERHRELSSTTGNIGHAGVAGRHEEAAKAYMLALKSGSSRASDKAMLAGEIADGFSRKYGVEPRG